MEAKVNFEDEINAGQSVSEPVKESETQALRCENGVCELTWKPGRPKAA
ncbi:MAG: hypothetical protein IPM23_14025 [Candidatus Melainabacteria bacterium]|nr:hypothetical protein [Candidatus Melainabacteria bacterium]